MINNRIKKIKFTKQTIPLIVFLFVICALLIIPTVFEDAKIFQDAVNCQDRKDVV